MHAWQIFLFWLCDGVEQQFRRSSCARDLAASQYICPRHPLDCPLPLSLILDSITPTHNDPSNNLFSRSRKLPPPQSPLASALPRRPIGNTNSSARASFKVRVLFGICPCHVLVPACLPRFLIAMHVVSLHDLPLIYVLCSLWEINDVHPFFSAQRRMRRRMLPPTHPPPEDLRAPPTPTRHRPHRHSPLRSRPCLFMPPPPPRRSLLRTAQ